jgi:hypothetical protein
MSICLKSDRNLLNNPTHRPITFQRIDMAQTQRHHQREEYQRQGHNYCRMSELSPSMSQSSLKYDS